jgi:hypothetical protein
VSQETKNHIKNSNQYTGEELVFYYYLVVNNTYTILDMGAFRDIVDSNVTTVISHIGSPLRDNVKIQQSILRGLSGCNFFFALP